MSYHFFEWLKFHRKFLKYWDHQFFLWGQDIKCIDGDQLKGYGLIKFLSEQPLTYSSAYFFENQQVEYWFWAYGVGIYSKRESKAYFFSRNGMKLFVTERVMPSDPFLLLRHPGLMKKISFARDWNLAKNLFSDFLLWCGRYELGLREKEIDGHRKVTNKKSDQVSLPLDLDDFWFRSYARVDVMRRNRGRFGLDLTGLRVRNLNNSCRSDSI